MLAQQFVDKLEGTGLLHPDIIAELRRQLADTKGRVTVEALAKLLVDNGHLTKFQATKLVSELKDDSAPAPPLKAPIAKSNANELVLAPLEGSASGAAKAVVPNEVVGEAEIVEDEVEEVEGRRGRIAGSYGGRSGDGMNAQKLRGRCANSAALPPLACTQRRGLG